MNACVRRELMIWLASVGSFGDLPSCSRLFTRARYENMLVESIELCKTFFVN